MRLEHIALGGLYQIETPFVRAPTVRVEAIDVHHLGQYQRLEQILVTALVWVHEGQRGLRYPVSPQALRPAQDSGSGRRDDSPRLAGCP